MNLNQQIENWFNSRKVSFPSSASRPFVTLAYAQGLDGSITTRRGEVLPLSGPESTRLTHQLRSLHDGILVGIGTVLTDDPQLTVRAWNGPNPQPIVVDSLLRMPHTARLCHHPDKLCWILTGCNNSDAYKDKADILTIACPAQEPQVPLDEALKLLHSRGIHTLMVEGGARIITAFLRSRLADAVVITIAPRLIGGYKAIGNLGNTSTDDLPHVHPLNTAPLGEDMIVWGDLHYGKTMI